MTQMPEQIQAAGYRTCTQCVLNSSFPGITFDEQGVCSVCRSYEEKNSSTSPHELSWDEKKRRLETLCSDARKMHRPFDVLVPLSGGKDSMFVLYRAVKELGLRPLAFTLDNGYLTWHARDNIDRACSILGVEHIYYCMDPRLMRRLFRTFMEKTGYFCSVCMRAIGMATELVAQLYDIPLVFGGSASRVELPTAPEMFQSGPPDFIKNVLRNEPIAAECSRLMFDGHLKRRIGYRLFWWGPQRHLRICAWINLPDYLEWNYASMYRTIRDELGWRTPTGSDEEHIDCEIHKASEYIHDRRWKGCEIRRLTFAGLIMAGQMTRSEAIRQLETKPLTEYAESDFKFFLDDMELSKDDFDACIDRGPRYIQYRPGRSRTEELLGTVKRILFENMGLKRA